MTSIRFNLILGFFSLSALAMGPSKPKPEAKFEAFQVPGATCGDGSAYRVHIKPGDPNKFLIHFQGGGACWDWKTCFGPKPFTRLKEEADLIETVTSNAPTHPLADYTYVYLPYCTGDIFTGTHQGYYMGKGVRHVGRSNTEKAFDWISSQSSLSLSDAGSVFVYGESAGALGALLNLDLIEPLLPETADRFLMPDSPGLHFNGSIWKRFSAPYFKDLVQAMQRNGLRLNKSDGVIASQMLDYCHNYSHWNIGILQGSRDFVMSSIFGNRTPFEHENIVYGPTGIYKIFGNSKDRCAAWTPSSGDHVYVSAEKKRNVSTSDGVKPLDFLSRLLDSTSNEFINHR